ncbi:MAG: oligopeptidase B [Bacteroidetes bacterium]|nr:MAG: oligopeptidase B [Bacteroidota bacterium]
MNCKSLISSVVFITIVISCGTEQKNRNLDAPEAERRPRELIIHDDLRIDNYYWLKEKKNPDVVDHLEAENAYTEQMTAHTSNLQAELYKEIIGRIKQTDISVPYKQDDYYYYRRYEEGKNYPIYCRKKGSLEAAEEIMLNVNQLSEGYEFYKVGSRQVSYDQQILAYEVDTSGDYINTIHFKNLETGEMIDDLIPNVSDITWANDNKTIFYTTVDAAKRPFKVMKHVLGTDHKKDKLVYFEQDDTYNTYAYRTKSKQYLMIVSMSKTSSEYRYLDAFDPDGRFQILQPREEDHEYEIAHYDDKFYILTNLEAKNFRLMETQVDKTAKENWKEIIPHRDNVLIEDLELFSEYLVVQERENGLKNIRIIKWEDWSEHYLNFGESTYTAYLHVNRDFNTNIVRYGYNSLTTPRSVYDYNMDTKEKELLKQDEVVGGFNSDEYQSERIFAKAKDGTKIPISIVYKKGTKKDRKSPMYLTGYGSYGASYNPYFSTVRLSILNRGFIYAIAHIRGGQEMGRYWYEEGKMLNKRNTFTDFIACAEHLVAEKYTSTNRLMIQGGSAGGLLMGAVTNMRPDLFHGVIMSVPFVDVVTTMLDPSIPLTTSEYSEWGNPNDKEYYHYMLSYSPFDNIEAKDYPAILVLTGFNDAAVQYWEPAKFVAKLRALKTDDNPLLFKCDMGSGHQGPSGRYDQYHKIAFEYAWMFDMLGIDN